MELVFPADCSGVDLSGVVPAITAKLSSHGLDAEDVVGGSSSCGSLVALITFVNPAAAKTARGIVRLHGMSITVDGIVLSGFIVGGSTTVTTTTTSIPYPTNVQSNVVLTSPTSASVEVNSNPLYGIQYYCILPVLSVSHDGSVAIGNDGNVCNEEGVRKATRPTFELEGLVPGAEYHLWATIVAIGGVGSADAHTAFVMANEPPSCAQLVAADPDNDDSVFGVGDTIQIIFNEPTNAPSILSADALTAFVSFSQPIGIRNFWQWSADKTTLIITVVDTGSASPIIGHLKATIDGSAIGLKIESGLSDVAATSCPLLVGDWGKAPTSDDVLLSMPGVLSFDEDTFPEIPVKVRESGEGDPRYFTLHVVVRDLEKSAIFYGELGMSLAQLAASPLKLPATYPVANFVGTFVVDVELHSGSSLVEQHVVVIQVSPINDIPSVSLVDKAELYANGQYHPVNISASSVAVGDPDETDMITVVIETFTTGVFFALDSGGAAAAVAGQRKLKLRQPISQINAEIARLLVKSETEAPFDVYVYVTDDASPPFFGSFSVNPLCDPSLPAAFESVVFKPDLFGLDLQFKAMMFSDVQRPLQCRNMFDPETRKSLGDGAVCQVSEYLLAENADGLRGFKSINVFFGSGATIAPGDTVSLKDDTAILVCTDPAGATTGTASLPGTVIPPTVRLNAKTPSLGLCDDLVIQGSVEGAGPWPVEYTWTEPTGVLFASFGDSLPTNRRELFIPAGKWPQVAAGYTVYLTVKAMHTGAETTENVFIKTSVEATPQILVPMVPSQLFASCTDYAISVSLPHGACNDPTKSVNYNWMVESQGKVVSGPWEDNTSPKVAIRIDDLRAFAAGLFNSYTVRLTATVDGSTSASRVSVPLSLECEPSVEIMGGSKQMHSTKRDFKLTSVVTDEFVPNSDVDFDWECSSGVGPCLTADFSTLTLSNAAYFQGAANTLPAGPMTFGVTANEDVGRAVSASVQVLLLEECLSIELSIMSASGRPLTALAAHDQISAQVRVLNAAADDDSDTAYPPVVTWDFDGIPATALGASAFIENSIDAPALIGGVTKTIKVSVSQYNPTLGRDVYGEASVEIAVQPPPAGGNVEFFEVSDGKYEVRTSGWHGGGSPIVYECFFAEDHFVSHADIPLADRQYLSVGASLSTTFYVDFIPTGELTLVVSAQNAYGRSFAATNVSIPEDPGQLFNLKQQTGAVLAESARTGSVVGPSQLFTVAATTIAGFSRRRLSRRGAEQDSLSSSSSLRGRVIFDNATRRSSPAPSGLAARALTLARKERDGDTILATGNQELLAGALKFYAGNADQFDSAGLVDKQWKIVKAVAALESSHASTKDVALDAVASVLSHLLGSTDAAGTEPIDASSGRSAVAMIESLSTLLFMRPNAPGYAARGDWADSLIQFAMMSAKKVSEGSSCPIFPGAAVDLSTKQVDSEMQVKIARILLSDATPFAANADGSILLRIAPDRRRRATGVAATVEASVDIMTVNFSTSPILSALGRPTMYGEELELVSSMTAIAFRPLSSTSTATSYVIELPVAPAKSGTVVQPTRTCFMWDFCTNEVDEPPRTDCEQAGWSTRNVATVATELATASNPADRVHCEVTLVAGNLGGHNRVAVFEDLRDNPGSSSTSTTETTTTTATSTTTTTTPHAVQVFNVNDLNPEITTTTTSSVAQVVVVDENNSMASIGWTTIIGMSIGALIIALIVVSCFYKSLLKSIKVHPEGAAARKSSMVSGVDDQGRRDRVNLDTLTTNGEQVPGEWKKPVRPRVDTDPFDDELAYDEETKRQRRERGSMQQNMNGRTSDAWAQFNTARTNDGNHSTTTSGASSRKSPAWAALGDSQGPLKQPRQKSAAWQEMEAMHKNVRASRSREGIEDDQRSLASLSLLPPAFGVERGASVQGQRVQKRGALRPISMPKPLGESPATPQQLSMPLLPVASSSRKGAGWVALENNQGPAGGGERKTRPGKSLTSLTTPTPNDPFRRQSAELVNPEDIAPIPFQIQTATPPPLGQLAPLKRNSAGSLAPLKRGSLAPLSRP